MQIGIHMDDEEYELTDTKLIVNRYGQDMGIGYLKINPERVPVIVGEGLARDHFEKIKDRLLEFDILCGNFVLLADKNAVHQIEDCIVIDGDAYIARIQGDSHTTMTYDEIEPILSGIEAYRFFSMLMDVIGESPLLSFHIEKRS